MAGLIQAKLVADQPALALLENHQLHLGHLELVVLALAPEASIALHLAAFGWHLAHYMHQLFVVETSDCQVVAILLTEEDLRCLARPQEQVPVYREKYHFALVALVFHLVVVP